MSIQNSQHGQILGTYLTVPYRVNGICLSRDCLYRAHPAPGNKPRGREALGSKRALPG